MFRVPITVATCHFLVVHLRLVLSLYRELTRGSEDSDTESGGSDLEDSSNDESVECDDPESEPVLERSRFVSLNGDYRQPTISVWPVGIDARPAVVTRARSTDRWKCHSCSGQCEHLTAVKNELTQMHDEFELAEVSKKEGDGDEDEEEEERNVDPSFCLKFSLDTFSSDQQMAMEDWAMDGLRTFFISSPCVPGVWQCSCRDSVSACECECGAQCSCQDSTSACECGAHCPCGANWESEPIDECQVRPARRVHACMLLLRTDL